MNAISPIRPFAGGVPTEPDVKALLQAITNLEPGKVVEHAEIEAVIKVDRRKSRYRTVVDAWRARLLREQNVDLQARAGVGFVVLTEEERVGASVRDYGSGARKMGRSVRRIGRVRVEQLEPADQRKVEHVRRHMEATLSSVRESTKEIAVALKPQESLPRRTAPGSGKAEPG